MSTLHAAIGRKRPATQIEMKRALDLYLAFGTASQIFRQTGIRITSVISHAHRLGVPLRGAAPSQREDDLREDYFCHWTPNMAWLLGYIQADGCLGKRWQSFRLGFSCKESDRQILDGIKAELGSSNTISLQVRKPTVVADARHRHRHRIIRPRERAATLQIRSKRLGESLVRHGILCRKSSGDQPLPNVPDGYLGHYTRGLIDGDGTIGHYQYKTQRVCVVSILGTPLLVSQLQHRMVAQLGVAQSDLSRPSDNNSLVCARWYSCRDLSRIIPWLYPDGDYLHLTRKRLIAAAIIENQKGRRDKYIYPRSQHRHSLASRL